MATIKLGDLLIKANVLQEGQLKAALAEQQKWGGRLGEILVRMNLITEEVLVKALSRQLGIPAVNLDAVQGIPPHVKAKLPVEMARDLVAVPIQLRDDGKTLVVAMAEPQNVETVDMIRARANTRVMTQVAGRTAIMRAIARFYEGEADVSDFEGSFKVVDSQGRTVVKSLKEIEAQAGAAVASAAAAPASPPPVASRGPVSLSDVPSVGKRPAENPVEILRAVEDVQRKEVAAIKAMVELLIEKGVFSREEYLAKVRR
ncbi:MAG: general secretion pathway protein GspE [Myxococcaceae bacterium]|nr:general secretion pathway protein GspE [Myxococcaceae bacterium]